MKKENDFFENIKKYLNKFWYLLWKDDSLKGWVFSIIILFIFIKFIFFPILSLATGTSLPLAIVESCSMYHEDNLLSDIDKWWEIHENNYEPFNIDQSTFEEFKFTKGFNKGDILFITGVDPKKIKVGDIIIFQSQIQSTPIIHRVVEIKEENGEKIFSTMGDNVGHVQKGIEDSIKENQIIGKASFNIAPYVGWVKLIFFEPKQPASKKGFCTPN